MTARKAWLAASLMFVLLTVLFFARMNAEPRYEDAWWNASWHYRMRIDVNTTNFSRENWPVEREMNFTAILNSLNVSGTFDPNSTKNHSPDIVYKLKCHCQFDLGDGFNASSNAYGELVFILNGTTQSSTARYFYLYFDTTENGNRSKGSYPALFNYTWDNVTGEAEINNSRFIVYIDTQRGENTSGIYRVWGIQSESEWFFSSAADEPTMEYTQISNGTNNLTFDMGNNVTFVFGPVRIRMTQIGDEILWNTSSRTNESRILKEYFFYPNSTWLRVKDNITNTGNSSISRDSNVGISAFDVARAYLSTYKVTGNESNPGSWIRGTYDTGGTLTGFIHINQSQDVFYATNTTSPQRIGIRMDNATITAGSSLVNVFAMIFGHTVSTPDIMEDTKDRLTSEVNVTEYSPEMWVVDTESNTSYQIYNRNESILITGNVTFDPWNLTQKMNATLDMGTPSGADDQVVALEFNSSYGNQTAGYRLFTGYFSLPNTSQPGYWNLTIRAYDSPGFYLNESYRIFNVTSEYSANLIMQNALGLPSRTIYASLDIKNYRQDTWIPGASINCSYSGTQVTNITDHGNGTYSINFTAPSLFGLYTLNCSGSKDGNLGYEAENFTVEAATTNLSISRSPAQYTASNVTLYYNESFSFNVSLQNEGNSSGYTTNVTLSLPANWTSSPSVGSCGDVPIAGVCVKTFNITVYRNATPGDYVINVSANWTNLDATYGSNSTYLNVTVSQNPRLEVPQDNLSAIFGPGNSTIAGSFVVNSTGNYQLNTINFSASGLGDFVIIFTPSSISSLGIGETQSVQVNVTAYSNQSPGIYEGVINISSANDGFDLVNLTVIVTGTNMSLERAPQNFTANVTYYQSDSFVLHAEANNTGNVTAFYASLNLSLPPSWTSNTSSYWCGNVSKGGNCSGDFLITVMKGTPSGYYPANITMNWQDIGIGPRSNASSVNVSVLSNRILVVPQNQFSKNISHGTRETIDTIILNSTGNDPISNITFSVSGFPNISIEFSPPSVSSLAAGSVQNILVNGTVPSGYDPGTYNGTINVTSNDGYKVINLSITVPQNGSWAMSPTYCEKVQSPDVGYVCNVAINNTGNLPLNFSIIPSTSSSNMSNYSWTNVTSFSIVKQQGYGFSVLYNVTGVAGQNWKDSNYTIDPQEAYASPGTMLLVIRLNPSLAPLLSAYEAPAKAEQLSYFVIYANAISQSGMGITYVEANVTRPGGASDVINMTWVVGGSCLPPGAHTSNTCWYANYSSGGWGSTVLRGNYSVKVTAYDNSLTDATNTTLFQVYTRMLVNFSCGSNIYAQGDMGYLNYLSRDYNYTVLPGTSVNMSITNPNGTTQGIIFALKNYTTDSLGFADPLPYFTLTSDAPLGNYTATAVSTYFDSNASVVVNSTNQFQFTVQGSTSQGIAATVETTVVWYPSSFMTFAIEVHDSNFNPVDPDQLNLTVYAGSPVLNIIYLQANLASPIMHKEGTGHYIVSYNTPASAGDYWAEIRAAKGSLVSPTLFAPFRVASGGPYDVRLRVLENEVPRGDYVDFEIVVENMGEAGQDVDLTYWVSDGNQSWSMASEAVYTPPQVNQTILRSLYVFSNQNLGLHTLNLLVNYSYMNPAIIKNATFMVTEAGAQPPQPPGGGGAPPEEGGGGEGGGGEEVTEIKIDYPDDVGVEVGEPRYTTIKIRNTGTVDVRNISLSLSGIDSGWFELGFPAIDIIRPNETKIIPLKLIVPSGTKSGEFVAKIKAESGSSIVQKLFNLHVFTSRRELIEFELERLKAKTDELEQKANQIKGEYDMEDVFKLIPEIRKKITETEDYLRDSKYDAALGSIYAGWKLYDDAADLLEKAQAKKAAELIPMWLLIVIILMIGLILFLVVVLRKLSLNMRILLRGRYTEAKTVTGIVKKEPAVDILREERDKVQRMLALLETQYRQGIISKEAYDGLRSSSEAKLKNLEERIRKELKV